MTKWEVCVLILGRVRAEESMMVRYKSGRMLCGKYISLAATDGTHRVIIDTGTRNPTPSRNPDYFQFEQNREEHLEPALRKHLGWSLDSVDTVINTHLHSDHCGGNYLFPNALFYIQRAEWEAAQALTEQDKFYYEPSDYGKKQISCFQWRFLDGDCDLFPGLRLIQTPGHTPGSQSVLLNTAEGTLCVAGDAVPTRRNMDEDLEPGISVDGRAALRSIALIRRYADFVLCGHDDLPYSGMRRNFYPVSN